MVLIISDSDDISTNDVIDWLNFYNVPFIRLNGNELIKIHDFQLSNSNVKLKLKTSKKEIIDFDNISVVWYRRGDFNLFCPNLEENNNKWGGVKKYLQANIINENIYTRLFLYYLFEGKPHINSYIDNGTSKLNNLLKAREVGLDIPFTTIVNKKSDFIAFYEKFKNNGIITKAIQNGLTAKINGYQIDAFTDVFNEEKMKYIPDSFYDTLLQENLEKEYELRIFYLDGDFYSSVIFSQNDPQTKIDFRNYDRSNENRIIPYELDEKTRIMISALMMQDLALESGSIDIIVNEKNDLYFLEVNPVGQFAWISKYSNLQIEKFIGNYFKYVIKK